MFYEQLNEICKKNGTSITAFTRDILKMSKGNIANWKSSAPSLEILQKISDYFNVSIDYLLDRELTLSEVEKVENKNETLIRILQLISNNFESDSAFEQHLGLKPKTVDSWKRGNSKAYFQMMPELAKTFNCTTDFLYGLQDNTMFEQKEKALLNGEQKEIFIRGKKITEEDLSKIIDAIDKYNRG